MAETFPFEIPAGNDMVPATSGTQNLGSASKPFSNIEVLTVNGAVPVNPSGAYLPLTGGTLSGDLVVPNIILSGSTMTIKTPEDSDIMHIKTGDGGRYQIDINGTTSTTTITDTNINLVGVVGLNTTGANPTNIGVQSLGSTHATFTGGAEIVLQASAGLKLSSGGVDPAVINTNDLAIESATGNTLIKTGSGQILLNANGGSAGDRNINVTSSDYVTKKLGIAVQDSRVISVGTIGLNGQVESITDAITAATALTPTATAPVVIWVNAGTYTEVSSIIVPSYVSIVGINMETVFIKPPATFNGDFITMSPDSNMSFVTIEHDGTPASRGIVINDTGAFIDLHKVYVKQMDKGITVENLTAGSENYLYLEYCSIDCPFSLPSTYALSASSDQGAGTFIQINTSDLQQYSTVINPTDAVIITGQDIQWIGQGVILNGDDNTAGNGITIYNGASASLGNININSFAKGLNGPNTGSAPTIQISAINFQDCGVTVELLNATTTGSIQGVGSSIGAQLVSPLLTASFLDPTNKVNGQMGNLYLGNEFSKLQFMSPLIANSATMGLLNGGELTDAGSLDIGINAGAGYVDTNPSDWTATKHITWVSGTLTLPASSDNYIYIDSNSVFQYSATSIFGDVDKVLLGRVVTRAVGIDYIEAVTTPISHASNAFEEVFRDAFGPIVADGILVQATAGLQIGISDGEYYFGSTKIEPTSIPTYKVNFYHSAGAWIGVFDPSGIWDNTQYDNGTNLAPIPAGEFTKHSVWLDGLTPLTYMVYGQNTYATQLLAEQGPAPTPSPTFKDAVVHLADIVVQEGSGTLVSITDTRPVVSFKQSLASAGTANNHSTLLNLSSDDHTQYLLVNGSRAMGNDLDMNGNNIINVSGINGIKIESHAGQHLPNGSDPLDTLYTPTDITVASASVGIQNILSRADHTHGYAYPTASNVGAIAGVATSGVGLSLVDGLVNNTQYINSLSGVGTVTLSGPANGVITISGASATWAGGTVTSSILPNANVTLDLGSRNLSFEDTYSNRYYGADLGIPLFNQGPRNLAWFTPLAAATATAVGTSAATIRATLTLPGWSTNYGYQQLISTSTVVANDAGIQSSILQFAQTSGSLATTVGGGYYAKFRFATPDVAYVGASGCRMFVGMTTQATNVPVASDSFAGDNLGISFCTASGSARQDSTFQLMSRNNTTTTISGLAGFAPTTNTVYDFYLAVPAIPVGGGAQYADYKLENVSAGTSIEGRITATLPRLATPVKPYIGIATNSSGVSTARTMRWSYMYVEGQY